MPLDVHFIIDPQKGSQRSATKYVTLSKPSNKASTQWTARECWNWKEPNRGGKQQRQRNMKKTWTLGKKKQGKQGQKGGRTSWLKRKANRTQCFWMWGHGTKDEPKTKTLAQGNAVSWLKLKFPGNHSTALHTPTSIHAHTHKHTHTYTKAHTNTRGRTRTTKSKVNHWNFAS